MQDKGLQQTFRHVLKRRVQTVGVVLGITLVTQQDVLPVLILPAHTAPFPRCKRPVQSQYALIEPQICNSDL